MGEGAGPFALVETMRVEGGAVALLDGHLARLRRSSFLFGVPLREHAVRRAVGEAVAGLNQRRVYRLRLLLHRDGRATTGATPLDDLSSIRTAAVYPEPVALTGVFCRHKTTRRDLYDEALAWALAHGVDEPLLADARGEVIEGARTNVWLRQANGLVTPALDGRGLPGVMRAAVLDRGPEAREGPVTVDSLHTGGHLLLSNAVRGLWEVDVVQVD